MRLVVPRPQLVAVLLVALMTTAVSFPQVELCVGLDGHVALEPVGASCCNQAEGAAILGADGHCATGCVDTPLEISLAPSGGDRQHATPPGIALIGASYGLSGGRPPFGTRQETGAPPSAPPRALRTTVFLC